MRSFSDDRLAADSTRRSLRPVHPGARWPRIVSVFLLCFALQAAAPAQSQTNVPEILRETAALIRQGDFSRAEPLARRAVSLAPQNADAHNLLGIILDATKQFPEAEAEYRQATLLSPKAVSPLANLGVLLARTGRGDEAVKMFESVLRLNPDHAQATLNLGLLYVSRGEYERAVVLLERADKFQPKDYVLLFNLGVALYHTRRTDEARVAFESAAALARRAEPLYYQGLIAFTGGRDDEARGFFTKALEIRSDYAAANFMLGELLSRQQNFVAAKDFYERALRLEPAQPVHHVRLGGVYLFLRETLKALEIFQQAAERFPRDPEIQYFVALAARSTGNYDLSLSALQKSIALQPDNADVLALLGAILSDRDDVGEAEKLLRRAIALNDKHFNAHHDLGRLLVRLRRYADALPVLQRAAALNPGNSDVHYKLFVVLSRLQRQDEAKRELAIFRQLEEEQKRAGAGTSNEGTGNPPAPPGKNPLP